MGNVLVIAVATGLTAADLRRAGAGVVLEQLTDTVRLVALIRAGRHGAPSA